MAAINPGLLLQKSCIDFDQMGDIGLGLLISLAREYGIERKSNEKILDFCSRLKDIFGNMGFAPPLPTRPPPPLPSFLASRKIPPTSISLISTPTTSSLVSHPASTSLISTPATTSVVSIPTSTISHPVLISASPSITPPPFPSTTTLSLPPSLTTTSIFPSPITPITRPISLPPSSIPVTIPPLTSGIILPPTSSFPVTIPSLATPTPGYQGSFFALIGPSKSDTKNNYILAVSPSLISLPFMIPEKLRNGSYYKRDEYLESRTPQTEKEEILNFQYSFNMQDAIKKALSLFYILGSRSPITATNYNISAPRTGDVIIPFLSDTETKLSLEKKLKNERKELPYFFVLEQVYKYSKRDILHNRQYDYTFADNIQDLITFAVRIYYPRHQALKI